VGLKHQSWNSTVHATILEGGHGKRKKAIIDRAVKIDCLLKLRLTIAEMFLDQRPRATPYPQSDSRAWVGVT
jgi:hypothetical protein